MLLLDDESSNSNSHYYSSVVVESLAPPPSLSSNCPPSFLFQTHPPAEATLQTATSLEKHIALGDGWPE